MLISAIAQLFDGVGPLVDAATSEAALQAGCDGLLCSPERLGRGGLLSVLEAMGSDGSHLDRGISALLQRGAHCGRSAQPPRLTLREESLLKGLCQGLSNQDIAAELHLSANTVKQGVNALLRKFDARDRSHWSWPPLISASCHRHSPPHPGADQTPATPNTGLRP